MGGSKSGRECASFFGRSSVSSTGFEQSQLAQEICDISLFPGRFSFEAVEAEREEQNVIRAVRLDIGRDTYWRARP